MDKSEKKEYVSPSSKVIEVDVTPILVNSPDGGQLQDYEGLEWGDN